MFISNLKNQVLDISDDPIWIPHVGLRPHGLKEKNWLQCWTSYHSMTHGLSFTYFTVW